jgi:hypothetical protein
MRCTGQGRYGTLITLIVTWNSAGVSVPLPAQTSGLASGQPRASWDVTPARGRTRAIEFDSSEGTFEAVDISPIAAGKLADLMVLEADPLADVHATRNARYVMKGGVLYDGMTLDKLWPRARPYGARPWLSRGKKRLPHASRHRMRHLAILIEKLELGRTQRIH